MADPTGAQPARAPFLLASSPPFFAAPGVDTLLYMVLAIAAELSSVSEQLDTLRRVVAAKGVLTLQDLDSFVPTSSMAAERAARREEFIATLLASLASEADALARATTAAANPPATTPR